MNLREEILLEHSKRQATKIANWVGDDKKRFEELLGLFLKDEYRVTQRAAYAFGIVADRHPKLVANYWGILIENLKKPVLHVAVKRNTIRLLQNAYLPDELLGDITEICFKYLASNDESIAVKAFSTTVLLNTARRYPDIKNELKMLIEDQLHHGSTGFVNRGKKVLAELNKL
jgi:hypothetical protein